MDKNNLSKKENEIERLSTNVENRLNSPYWCANMYGIGKYLKQYGFYPDPWPLIAFTSHGISLSEEIPSYEIDNDAPCMLNISPRRTKKYRTISNKPCYTILSPFVFYRRRNKININPDASGSIIFPGHSTDRIDNLANWKEYISELNQLPEKFKPLTICLHEMDVRKGVHKIFLEEGFEVKTAGAIYDSGFTERFYEILRRHKYSISNLAGSYAFYSVEMGIPFMLYGKEVIYFNHTDSSVEAGLYTSFKEQSTFKYAESLFKNFNGEITSEQKEFVEYELGLTEGISRFHAAIILYKSFVGFLIKKYSVIIRKRLMNAIKISKDSLNYVLNIQYRIINKIKRLIYILINVQPDSKKKNQQEKNIN